MDGLDVIIGKRECPSLPPHPDQLQGPLYFLHRVSENLSIGLKWLEC